LVTLGAPLTAVQLDKHQVVTLTVLAVVLIFLVLITHFHQMSRQVE
jgi:hypothetical protein